MKTIIRAALAVYLAGSLLASAVVSLGDPVARWAVLEHRAPFAVVEVVVSSVESVDADGFAVGADSRGLPICYRPHAVEVGNRVVSLLVYNPLTGHEDDVIAWYDIAVSDGAEG